MRVPPTQRAGHPVLALALVALLVAGCGGGTSATPAPVTAAPVTAAPATPAPASPAPATEAPATPAAMSEAPASDAPPAAAGDAVSIAGFRFGPAALTVKAGTTVTWTNNDTAPHTATADDGSFASDTLGNGATFSHEFDAAGTFTYHCAIHPRMTATIVVE